MCLFITKDNVHSIPSAGFLTPNWAVAVVIIVHNCEDQSQARAHAFKHWDLGWLEVSQYAKNPKVLIFGPLVIHFSFFCV